MTDLDLIPTDDLLKALKRRYDHMVFGGIKHMGGDQAEGFSLRSSGHSSPMLGLVHCLGALSQQNGMSYG